MLTLVIDFCKWYEVLAGDSEFFDSTRTAQLDDIVRNPITLSTVSKPINVQYSFIGGDNQQLQVSYSVCALCNC